MNILEERVPLLVQQGYVDIPLPPAVEQRVAAFLVKITQTNTNPLTLATLVPMHLRLSLNGRVELQFAKLSGAWGLCVTVWAPEEMTAEDYVFTKWLHATYDPVNFFHKINWNV